MDESTDGVTLDGAIILKVVEPFHEMERLCTPLFEMVRDVDPNARAPISLYNQACAWIEEHLGAASVRAAGEAIGTNIAKSMLREGSISVEMTPPDTLAALSRAVLAAIRDRKRRGWEVLGAAEGLVLIRRTQTFNCVMQEGFLRAYVAAAGAVNPRVEHVRCTRRSDPYCEYEVRWLPKRVSRSMPAIR